MPYLIKKGTQDVTRYVMIVDSISGAPETGVDVTTLDLSYIRAGSDHVAKVDATALATVDAAHADNKMIEVDATLFPGLYRVDWPDAAFATGVNTVLLCVTGSGFHPAIEEIELVNFDPTDAVRLGLTALPNAAADAAGGLPISDAGGLDIDAKLANTNEVTAARMGALTDWIDGGRLDLLLDATKAKTDNLPASPAAVGSAMTLANDAITAAVIATDAIDADALKADAITEIQAGLSTLDAAGVRAAIGMAAADLDAQLAAIAAYVDTEVAAIKAKTDNLPASPAAAGEYTAAIAALPSAAAIADAVWDELTSGHAGAGSTGAALTAIPTTTQIAAALAAATWGKNSETLQTILQHIHAVVRGDYSKSGAVVTVKHTDGTTMGTYTLASDTKIWS